MGVGGLGLASHRAVALFGLTTASLIFLLKNSLRRSRPLLLYTDVQTNNSLDHLFVNGRGRTRTSDLYIISVTL